MTAVRKSKQTLQQYVWLIGGLLFLFAAVVFWAITDRENLIELEAPIEQTTATQIQPEKVAAMNHLGALQSEVRPLEMTTRVVATSSDHMPEFRGNKFFQENKKASTIELFRASEEDIIKNFLKSQNDRKNFIYFRLSGEGHAEQYVMAYGTYKSKQEADLAISLLNVGLPATIKPQVTPFETYISLINDLGAEELKGNNKVYEVRLRVAPLPRVSELLPERTATTSLPRTNSSSPQVTTQTTVTRRDSSGNVVDVQRSQSTSNTEKPREQVKEPAKEKVKETTTPTAPRPEPQVSDPFN